MINYLGKDTLENSSDISRQNLNLYTVFTTQERSNNIHLYILT